VSSDASRATTNQAVLTARLARSARPFPVAAIFPVAAGEEIDRVMGLRERKKESREKYNRTVFF
jgi:hypothetical protein